MLEKLLGKYKPEKTVCFTGHRPERLPQLETELLSVEDRLIEAIKDAIMRGKINFVSGAMSGWDTFAAEQILSLKEKHPQIQCILIAPFSVRFFNNKNWTPQWEMRLREVIKNADFCISLSENSYKGVYFARDRAIVEMSSEVIAYYDGGSGGTKYTIEYAMKKNRRITNIADILSE